MSKFKNGPMVLSHAGPSATAINTADQQDGNSAKGTIKRTVSGTSYKIYPWGTNNKLPNEMVDLYRSNGDVMNLVQTRADFLFGAGCGWFRHRYEGKTLIREPYTDNKVKDFEIANDVQELVNTQLTYLVETGNAFVNQSREKGKSGQLVLSMRDSLTVRAVVATKGYVDTWLLAPDWSQPKAGNIVAVPSLTLDTRDDAPETLYQIKRKQSGQFYYGFAIWWAAAEWIRLANRVPAFHNTGLDTEYNASRICRVAEDYINKFGGDTDETRDAFREKFYQSVDGLLFGGEGTRRVIFDECAIGPEGKMVPYIEFEDIKTQLTGKEYTELYQMAVTAFANASGILSGLAGVSDGKTLGGSGSELRVSAEYQQFYRTPRDRQAVESYWNRQIKPQIGLPDDVYFGFNNILLETLDKEKSGSSQKSTGSGGAASDTKETGKETTTETKKK
ncbi:hypothetical protein [Spirosoma sp.]|uniref:hypothetical protein n=1 Tax=Spirosoma sp. TaxID=1899569 RepID=UPI0026171C66|nr:hypothetical protein [Spirosoma sp.]MCX6216401.1 hypothetical protein [Spirosoma sp.]